MLFKGLKLGAFGITLVGLSSACTGETKSQGFLAGYTDMVHETYQQSYEADQEMMVALKAFVEQPSAESQDAAKQAWTKARMVYGLTEAYRFYDGPIDNAEGPEGSLNSWPMDEGYVDYVYDTAKGDGSVIAKGLIANTEQYPKLTKDVLRSRNQQPGAEQVDGFSGGGEENVALGYHTIEFLLWGQDLDQQGKPQTATSGQRSHEDYVVGTAHAERRGTYLLLVAELILEDKKGLVDVWHPTSGAYAKEFKALPAKEALAKLMTGLATLAEHEMASERIGTAYGAFDQEHEQSCFSDMTHLDQWANLQGIANILRGRIDHIDFQAPHDEKWQIELASSTTRIGLIDYIRTENTEQAEKLVAALKRAEDALADFPVPFDAALAQLKQETSGMTEEEREREALKAANVFKRPLEDLGYSIVDAAKAIGVDADINNDD